MLKDDEVDHLLVFRQPGAPPEVVEADVLLGGGPRSSTKSRGESVMVRVRVYALVDIERQRPPRVVAAVEVSLAPTSRSWQVVHAGGDPAHHRRLATELVRVATGAGAARVTLAPDASSDAERLLRSWPGATDGGRGLSVQL